MTVPDRQLLYVTAFVRALATGMMGVLLGLHLATLQLSEQAIGGIIAAGLSGAALASLFATAFADRHGRRRSLIELALLGAAGGIAVSVASDVLVIAAATFIGMLNGMGRDRGASLVLEQAMLPATTTDRERTRVFANYNVLQDAGHALGSLLAGLPTVLHTTLATPTETANRAGFGLYAALIGLSALVYLRLSPAVEVASRPRIALAPESRRILWRVSALFSLDALGGGFLTTSLLSYFFFERFGADPGLIAVLFFFARMANAISHLGAAWLARRIGLVNTMVFTHVPSSLLLVTVAYAPNFPVAVIFFLLREGLVEMDVPTRQSYVMAVMRPEERTVASGVTHLVRMACWAITAWLAGYLMQDVSLMTPLVVGAAMKITYDIALYVAFRNVRPPEEIAPTTAG